MKIRSSSDLKDQMQKTRGVNMATSVSAGFGDEQVPLLGWKQLIASQSRQTVISSFITEGEFSAGQTGLEKAFISV